MKMDEKTRRLVFKIITDIVCLLLVGFPILIFYVAGSPYERGFFCDDESLQHPYRDSTVTNVALYFFGLGLPILCIIGTEIFLFRYCGYDQPVRSVLNKAIPPWVWASYKHIGVFGFGAACSQLTTDVAKYTIGRLRPHFFDVCQPEVNCQDLRLKGVYIQHFRCRGHNQKLLKDMRLSFPSGHASFSTYCMLFLVMYLHAKLKWRGSKLIKHVLQYLAILLAVYTSLTRISDYKHHWSDVLFGVVQGAVVSILVVVFVSDIFAKPPLRDSGETYNPPPTEVEEHFEPEPLEQKDSHNTVI